MKLGAIVLTALALSNSALACLEWYGQFRALEYSATGNPRDYWGVDIEVKDNGRLVCKSNESLGDVVGPKPHNWVDGSKNLAIRCLPGYVFTIEKNNGYLTVWYRHDDYSRRIDFIPERSQSSDGFECGGRAYNWCMFFRFGNKGLGC